MKHGSTSSCSQQKLCGYEYTVKRGDSFYLIAQRLGVPLRDLLAANSNINPARLMVGDVLCIPVEEDDAVQLPAQEAAPTKPSCCTAAPQQPASQQPATQQPAQPSTTQPITIVEITPVPSEIHAEDIPEILPAPAESATPVQTDTTPETKPTPTPSQPTTVTPVDPGFAVCPDANLHTVAVGETIADIQQRADLSLRAIAAANPGIDLDSLAPGEELCIPSQNIPCTTARFYRMQDSQNLERLALQMDISVGALLRANPCLAPSDFKGGTVVSLP